MSEDKLLKSLREDILAVFKKNNIEFDRDFPLLKFDMKNIHSKTVIDDGKCIEIHNFVINIEYQQTGCLMTAEDEFVWYHSFYHPSPLVPHIRKEVNHTTGEAEITIDGQPCKIRWKRNIFRDLFCGKKK